MDPTSADWTEASASAPSNTPREMRNHQISTAWPPVSALPEVTAPAPSSLPSSLPSNMRNASLQHQISSAWPLVATPSNGSAPMYSNDLRNMQNDTLHHQIPADWSPRSAVSVPAPAPNNTPSNTPRYMRNDSLHHQQSTIWPTATTVSEISAPAPSSAPRDLGNLPVPGVWLPASDPKPVVDIVFTSGAVPVRNTPSALDQRTSSTRTSQRIPVTLKNKLSDQQRLLVVQQCIANVEDYRIMGKMEFFETQRQILKRTYGFHCNMEAVMRDIQITAKLFIEECSESRSGVAVADSDLQQAAVVWTEIVKKKRKQALRAVAKRSWSLSKRKQMQWGE